MKVVSVLIICLVSYIPQCFSQQEKLVSYVDPFIGTSNNANTYPGATLPWGMVSINPFNVDNPSQNNIAVSYQKGNRYIYGFTQNRLSGVGCPDMSSISIMPSQGLLNKDSVKSEYTNEIAKPGFYSVQLLKNKISVATTATLRSSLSSYVFNTKGLSYVSLNLGQSLSKNKGDYLNLLSDTEIEGYKTEGGFCGAKTNHKVYFYLQISKKSTISLWEKNASTSNKNLYGDEIGAFLQFETDKDESILVKVGLSYVSSKNAKDNLNKEQFGWDFKKMAENASSAWEKELQRINVKGNLESDKKIFYTGIYHMLQHPNVISDNNGDYMKMGDDEIMNSETPHYSVYSLWDTYRNVHPFLTLVYPEKQQEMIISMVDMYKQSGWLPKWELASQETYVMVGDPSTIVIADSYLKGIKGFDIQSAYQAMMKSAFKTDEENPLRPGLKQYLSLGYIPNDDKGDVWGSVSTTLEYCYADWSLAQIANSLGDLKNYKMLIKRSNNYKNLFDKNLMLMRPKLANGSWFIPFDPLSLNGEQNFNGSGGPGFVEGTSWQYTWFVPHDMKGLIKLMGGSQNFVAQLNKTFDEDYFSLWNEPDMAYPYLYNYVKGQEFKAQTHVKNYIKEYFNTTSSGVPGNDDCGALSAWVVFGMIGFYPDSPTSTKYALTTPLFDEITIKLNTDFYPSKAVTIKKHGTNDTIQKIKLNDKFYKPYFIDHKDLVNSETLEVFTN